MSAAPKKVKPPKGEWPTYIVDMGVNSTDRWTIRYFADYETTLWDDKVGWTYSAISYAWGYWHDKRPGKWIDSTQDTKYPAFDPKITATWKFPVVNKNMAGVGSFLDPVDPIFTIDELKATLKALGTRFVWWDWACNIQGDNDELKQRGLLDFQAVEVDKMRFVYPRSINGCLWLHTSTWAHNNKAMKGAVQMALEQASNITLAGYPNLSSDAVEAYIGLLSAAVKSQPSLTSVWSFQEGILFGDDTRPYLGPSPTLKSGSSTCAILDHNAESFNTVLTEGLHGGDLVQDIVGVATNIVNIIVGALVDKVIPPPKAPVPLPFTKWCQREEASARSMVSRMIATGLVSYHYNNPITLLESKFCRTLISWWQSEADTTVKAVMGAMDVHIDDQVLKDAVAKRERKRAEAIQQGLPNPDSLANKAEAEHLRPPFLTALIKVYQWRMLLLAKDNANIPANKAWWMIMLEVKRPALASIGYYVNDGMVGLETMYRPGKPRPTTLPPDVYDLPELTVASKDEMPLIANKKSAYRFYDLTKATTKGWQSCIFYEFLKQPEDQPGTVGLSQIPWTDAKNTRDAKLGMKIVLFPIVDSTEKETVGLPGPGGKMPPKWRRCAIFSGYDAAAAIKKATFKGIGDFTGLTAADLVGLDNDVELW